MLAALGTALGAQPSVQRPLRPRPRPWPAASTEFVGRFRADAFTSFRFIDRAWTARVCEAFADVTNPTTVRLHGDAHDEQFAVTQDAWGEKQMLPMDETRMKAVDTGMARSRPLAAVAVTPSAGRIPKRVSRPDLAPKYRSREAYGGDDGARL